MSTGHSLGYQPRGWSCPHCGMAHGPHVDTCPNPPQQFEVATFDPSKYGLRPVRCPTCDAGQPCGNVACPYRAEVTCWQTGKRSGCISVDGRVTDYIAVV